MIKIKKLVVLILIMGLLTGFYASFTNNAMAVMDVKGTFAGGVQAEVDTTSITNITKTVLAAIRYTGSGIALIMLTYAFIRYMLSAASERAEIKKNLIPFVIGAVVLFAASNIVTILQEVAAKAFVTT